MEIRKILNVDFMQFLELCIEMYKEIKPEMNNYAVVNTINVMINQTKDFTAFGIYENNTLMGFVFGFAENDETFYFAGIYMIHKSTDDTQKLIEHCFGYVEEQGYKAWEADATNKNIASILTKYGAAPKFTKYRKEF